MRPGKLIATNNFGIKFPIRRETKVKVNASRLKSVRKPTVSRITDRSIGEHLNKLEGITVCVGYSDYLDITLPWNIRHFDKFVIVTHPDDTDTQAVVNKHGGLLVLCPECKGKVGGFNKGLALNTGIEQLDYTDWVLFTDSDILLPSTFRNDLLTHNLDIESMYYAARWYSPEVNIVQWTEDYKKNENIIHSLPSPHRDPGSIVRDVAPWGYFQLVNARSQVLSKLGRKPCSTYFNSAGGVDKQFHERWPPSRKRFSGYDVVHLFHGEFGANWRGRTTPPLPGKAETIMLAKVDAELPIAWLDEKGYQFVTDPPSDGYVKLVRMDTLDYVIIHNVPFPHGLFVDARGGFSYGAYHSGLISRNHKYATHPNHKGKVIVARDARRNVEYSGWGIGHVMFEDNRQAWVWAGQEISPTPFEIYWKQSLSDEDRGHLVPT
jgi:hypothetical protein